jgi:CubicO group peptidase (beta-lactamase class C family)
VLLDGEVHEAATGFADVRTGSPLTPRHVCLVGSTAKVLTATLLMQLVDEGLLNLDAPVTDHVKHLDLPSDITVAHLLSHTSGLAMGPYADHNRNDDAVASYAESISRKHVVCGAGERWGYSNAGFVIAGRIVELLRMTDWDTALRRHLLEPAGLTESATLPEEAILHPVALPHLRSGDAVEVAPGWGIAGRAMGPTGSSLVMTAADLVKFAAVHLSSGIASDGTRLLSAESVDAMMQPRAEVSPGSPFADQWGLGWYLAQWGTARAVGHTGHNHGAGSHLMLFPDAGGAISVVFNTVPGDAGLVHELFRELASELFGAAKPTPWKPVTSLPPEDTARHCGRYTCSDFELEVQAVHDEIEVTVVAAGLRQPPRRMRPVLDGAAWGTGQLGEHAAAAPPGQLTPEVFFSEYDGLGRPQFAHLSVFLARRTTT